jgi:hypothetical protein
MLPTDIAEGILWANVFGGVVVKKFFGDGSDGALSTSGNVTLTSTEDGPLVVEQYTSLTINSGHTMTVQNRCAGLVIYVQGDCIINGTLHMDAKGGRSDQVPFAAWRKGDDFALLKLLPANRFAPVGGAGGAGGRGGDATYGGAGGSGGPGRLFGGGYGGGGGGGKGPANGYGGAGGSVAAGILCSIATPAAIPFGSGGAHGVQGRAGGPGAGGTGCLINEDATQWEGSGGGAGPGGGGGGGKDGGGAHANSGAAGSYPGGLLVLVVGGNLTIGATGVVRTAGGNGGNGGNGVSGNAGGGGGGGGSGGGAILVLHRGGYTNSGSVTAPGGSGGSGGSQSGSGGNGVAGSSGSAGTVEVIAL